MDGINFFNWPVKQTFLNDLPAKQNSWSMAHSKNHSYSQKGPKEKIETKTVIQPQSFLKD